MQEMVGLARSLCQRWMSGDRDGGARRAWEHPEDVVRLLMEEMPSSADPEEREARAVLGWLHDLIEDGTKEDGTKVEAWELIPLGIPDHLASEVVMLTNPDPRAKMAYLSGLARKSPRARLIKCADRICNLREGARSFSDGRWVRYVGETYYFIYPIAADLGPEGLWLQERLLEAAQLRRAR